MERTIRATVKMGYNFLLNEETWAQDFAPNGPYTHPTKSLELFPSTNSIAGTIVKEGDWMTRKRYATQV